MQQQELSPATSIFCAAAPSDMRLLAQWERHLLPLIQVGRITVWSELDLMAGTDRLQQIKDHLDHAHTIVFLLSAEFFASDECMALMEQALKSSARVIPLLLCPVDWKTSKLAHLACLPANGQFVTTWGNLDQAFHTCVDDLRQLLGLPAVSPQTRKPARALTLQNQNRLRMLRRLRRSYTEMMNQSLQGITWLELGLTNKPDAVQNAAHLLLCMANRPEQLLAPSTSITQAYDEAAHELLILGKPGAGKSTLLLDLAQQLVERAEHDESHPLPVILPLSSWAIKRGPLEGWIAEQMSEIYDLPRKLSTQWVQERHILPLLDGLDEMDEAARPTCIVAINAYHREHLMPLMVCSRTTEYETATGLHRLALECAVVVQPLTYEDTDAYLERAGKPLTALRSTLRKNEALQLLSTTPLMLNILILTYQGSSLRNLSNRQELLQKLVWDDYMQRMVERKGNRKRYPLKQTRAQLSYLARQMRDRNQTVFYLEQLQPDWLGTSSQPIYVWQAIRGPSLFIGALMGILVLFFFSGGNVRGTHLPSLLQYGVLGGLLGSLWRGPGENVGKKREHHDAWGRRLVKRVVTSACIGLIYGLSFGLYLGGPGPESKFPYTLVAWQIDGLSSGVMIGLSSLLLQYLLMRPFHLGRPFKTSAPRFWERVTRFWSAVQGSRALLVVAVIGLSFGLSLGLSYAFRDGWSFGQSYLQSLGPGYGGNMGIRYSMYIGLNEGLNHGLSYGLSYALISLTLGSQMGDIHLAERIKWTWRTLLRGLFNSRHLCIAILLVCIIPTFFGLNQMLSTGLVSLLSHVLGDVLRDILSNEPTSGLSIWLEMSYALINGLTAGLSTGLSIAMSYWFLLGLIQGTTQEQIEDQDRRRPNQGVHRSLRNSVIMAIIGGGIIGSMSILSYGLRASLSIVLRTEVNDNLGTRLNDVLRYGFMDGLSEGLCVGLVLGISGAGLLFILTGGLAAWRHYVIRSLLWRSRCLPWRAKQFLDDATARFLLRRVGGGYSFSHRLLLDHLADAETSAMSSPNASST